MQNTDEPDNHLSYSGMERPQSAPKPIVLGGFEETTNNTDKSDDEKFNEENKIDTEQMSFAPRNEPSESTGPCQSEKDFIFSYMKGQNPTLFFRNGDIVELAMLNNMDAEIVEFIVKKHSKVLNKKIIDLNFPREAIIGGVIRGGHGLIALGDFEIQLGDRVLVCSTAEALNKVESLFL